MNLQNKFGFTSNEVKTILDYTLKFKSESIKYKSMLFDKLKYWYNGQIVGKGIESFTPYSVISYLSDFTVYNMAPVDRNLPTFQKYWTGNEVIPILKSYTRQQIFKIKNIINKLMKISLEQELNFKYDVYNSLYSTLRK